MTRDEARDLLLSQHTFPGPFEFRVVVRSTATSTAISAIAAGGVKIEEVGERKSDRGSYIALHVKTHVDSADDVLDVWEVLRGVDGVVAQL
jgi:putative lipoic acid-binding regulatory protein